MYPFPSHPTPPNRRGLFLCAFNVARQKQEGNFFYPLQQTVYRGRKLWQFFSSTVFPSVSIFFFHFHKTLQAGMTKVISFWLNSIPWLTIWKKRKLCTLNWHPNWWLPTSWRVIERSRSMRTEPSDIRLEILIRNNSIVGGINQAFRGKKWLKFVIIKVQSVNKSRLSHHLLLSNTTVMDFN